MNRSFKCIIHCVQYVICNGVLGFLKAWLVLSGDVFKSTSFRMLEYAGRTAHLK